MSRGGNIRTKILLEAQGKEKFGSEGSSVELCGKTYHLFLIVLHSHQACYTATMLLTL